MTGVWGKKKRHFAKLKEQIGQIFEVWKFLNIEVSVIMEILVKKKMTVTT